MNKNTQRRKNIYERVMPRVHGESLSCLKSNPNVTRHKISPVPIGGKASSSNLTSGVFSELPTVLNDYVPDSYKKPKKTVYVARPKKTLQSLDPIKSPLQVKTLKNTRKLHAQASAPTILNLGSVGWSSNNERQCFTSRSHTNLKELKEEIKAFEQLEKTSKFRGRLYKSCGVLLDERGQVAVDNAIQAEELDKSPPTQRTGRSIGENARAPVSDQQMRPASSRYPVDRYLVESSKNMDMVKIIDDDLWKPEPALRPEDEFMLRKLHEMLQSTADDLRLLSGELSKYHESGVQTKTLPTPLDDDFNEKIHIEEVVNAKFHGHEILNPSQSIAVPRTSTDRVQEIIARTEREKNTLHNSSDHIIPATVQKKSLKNLKLSRTKIVHIPESANKILDNKSVDVKNTIIPSRDKAVLYNEIIYQYEDRNKDFSQKPLQIQEMPSINIRSELKTQNVLQLDIIPDINAHIDSSQNKNNICVIAVNHDEQTVGKKDIHRVDVDFEPPPIRKVSKMSSYESSESSRNIEFKRKDKRSMLKELDRRKTQNFEYNISKNRSQINLNDWKRKLNVVYGQSSKVGRSSNVKCKKTNTKTNTVKPINEKSKVISHGEYIPYKKLTLGGVNVKEIEKEISGVSNKKDIQLSPILDKILSNHNSLSNEISEKKEKSYINILNTSDEKLLQEVLDIEEKVSITLSKNVNKDSDNITPLTLDKLSDEKDENTYADDFEAYNSEEFSESSPQKIQSLEISPKSNMNKIEKVHNKTFIKASNLSFKNHIDTFEFIPTVDTRDSATQSNSINKIALKETQTSPRNDDYINKIRNELTIDPKQEVEKMFNLEKDFIKKLIVDEYSDLIVNLNKPSTSNDSKAYTDNKNISTTQKNTQTSPAHVKNVMTSPTRTKTRTTSPFAYLSVNKQTSPLLVDENNLGVKSETSVNKEDDELDITINLSSPRFSLRIPRSSPHVSNSKENVNNKKIRQKCFKTESSSSSAEDYTSSDISFGEINRQFRKQLRSHRISSVSESSSGSLSKCSDQFSVVAPTRSEGEISLCQTKSNKYTKSEGEISLGQL